METDDPATINQFLRYVLTGYRVRGEKIVEIIFKDED